MLKQQAAETEARCYSSEMEIDSVDGITLGKRIRHSEQNEDIKETMRELSEMEHKLQSATRRQRLAVEASDLHVETESSGLIDLKPQPHLPKRDSSLSQDLPKARLREQRHLGGFDVNLTKDTVQNALEEAIETTLDGEFEADIDGNAEETSERGAHRPPPVNSDILPLPWEGRLGYVRAPVD